MINYDIPSHKSIFNRIIILSCHLQQEAVIEYSSELNQDMITTIESISKLGNFKILYSGKKIFIKPIETSNKRQCVKIRINESGSTLRFIIPLIISLSLSAYLYGEGALAKRPILDFLYSLKENISYTFYSDSKSYFILIKTKNTNHRVKSLAINNNKTSQYISSTMMFLSTRKTLKTILVKKRLNPISNNYIILTSHILRGLNYSVVEDFRDKYRVFNNRLLKKLNYYCIDSDCNAILNISIAALLKRVSIRLKVFFNQNNLNEINYLLHLFSRLNIHYQYKDNFLTIYPSDFKKIDLNLQNHIEYFPSLIALSLYSNGTSRFTGIEHSQYHESKRISAIIKALYSIRHYGVYYNFKTLYVEPKENLLSGIFPSSNDHRIAMCGSLISIRDKDVIVDNKEVIKKSFTNFVVYINSL